MNRRQFFSLIFLAIASIITLPGKQFVDYIKRKFSHAKTASSGYLYSFDGDTCTLSIERLTDNEWHNILVYFDGKVNNPKYFSFFMDGKKIKNLYDQS